MAGMAASVGLFKRNIEGSDRDLVKFDRTTQDVGRNIDKLSGRLGLLVDVAATLGPALIPTATAAVPLLAGLSNQLGFAAVAGGTAILAFHGVGDALKAVNTAGLDPSTANLEKMHAAMAQLGPAGREFVRQLQAMEPQLKALEASAQAGLFPGLADGIESLTTRMPQVQRIISEVSSVMGDLSAKAGKSLAGPEWDSFFNMLETEARPTLTALGESIGQVTKGLADLWVAFAPLDRDFSNTFLSASKSFADWANGLSQTQGFADFMAYLDSTGPKVAAALGAISKAVIDVLTAAAPLGGPALKAITAFADAIAAVASSDLGTPIFAAIAAWRAYSLAVGLAEKAQSRFNMSNAFGSGNALTKGVGGAKSWASQMASDLGVVTTTWATAGARSERESTRMATSATRLKGSLKEVGRGAAGLAALGVASTGVADKFGLANTASLALAGTFIAPGWGTAIGAAAGGLLDLKTAGESFNDTLKKLDVATKSGSITAINKQLADAHKQINDINHTSGVGDFFSDIGKTKGVSLLAKATGGKVRSPDADASIFAANLQKGSIKLAAAVKKQADAMQLANAGYSLTATGAREAAGGITAFTAAVTRANAALGKQSDFDAYKTSLLDAADALKENGKTLNANTRAGLANRASLRAVAAGAIQASTSMTNFARRTAFLTNARKNFINLATSMGLPRKAAAALATSLGLIPRAVKTKVTVNTGNAAATLASIRAQIAALHDKNIRIGIIKRTTSGGEAPGAGVSARGNIFHYAQGDVANHHMPELAGPGPTRMWREPETQGEAYIPLANDSRRPRARSIAMETVGLLGGDPDSVEWFAGGGHHKAKHGAHKGKSNTLKEAIDRLTKSVDAETASRDDLVSKRNDLASTVSGAFQNDPFASQGSVWSAGGGFNPLGVLQKDTANAKQFGGILSQLKKNGVSGQALAAIASTGNVQQASQLLAMGASGDQQYTSAFNQRAAAANAVGAYAGNSVYGAAIARDNAELKVANAHLKELVREQKAHHKNAGKHAKATGDAAGHAVNKTAAAVKHRKRRK